MQKLSLKQGLQATEISLQMQISCVCFVTNTKLQYQKHHLIQVVSVDYLTDK